MLLEDVNDLTFLLGDVPVLQVNLARPLLTTTVGTQGSGYSFFSAVNFANPGRGRHSLRNLSRMFLTSLGPESHGHARLRGMS